MSYYSFTDYVSNSELGEFHDFVNARPPRITNERRQEIYNDGSLVDAMVFEPSCVNFITGELNNNGILLHFSDKAFNLAVNMRDAVLADDRVGKHLRTMKGQHAIFRKQFQIQYLKQTFSIRAKCKFDGLNKELSMGADLKTTACTSYDSFLRAFYFFNYDRQAAWYMDVGQVDRMFYIGVCKHKNRITKTHLVYVISVSRDSDIYLSGLEKYSRLAYQYYHTIYNLDLSNIKLEI